MRKIPILLIPVLAAAILMAPPAPAQQPGDEVHILVSARDKYDRLITNLQKADIRVYEDGVLRPITRFEIAGGLPISMQVLIDTSGSVERQSAAVPIVAKLFLNLAMKKGRDVAAITSFGKTTTLVQSATDDVSQLEFAIDKIAMQTAIGPTHLVSSLIDAANRLKSSSGRRVVLLISDGMDTTLDGPSWTEMLEMLQKNGVAVYPMYCFCQGKQRPGDPQELKFTLDTWGGMTLLAEETGGTAYLPAINSALAIERDLRQIEREMTAQRLLSFQPGRSKKSKSLHKIRIESANPELKGLKFKYRHRY
jgi:Ca-activated chloride channel homolog